MVIVMICEICNSSKAGLVYHGKIRNGSPDHLTNNTVTVFQCSECRTFWHDASTENSALYESNTYRENMGEIVSLSEFYKKHDVEIIDKLNYTGTEVYRNKLFMDVGCGGGGYADYINGVARQTVLIEPNESFADQLRNKGYEVYPYMCDALSRYKNSVELLTSYDVIEHVDDPQRFIQLVYDLLAPGGTAYVGTPTEYPILRQLLGVEFDAFVFSMQHIWVFSRASLEIMAKKSGFTDITVKFYQRFGIGNLISWLQMREPRGEAQYSFLSPALNSLYKTEMAKEETAEYLVLELRK